MAYQTLKSEWRFHGQAFNVKQDNVLLPNGKEKILDIVIHKGAVTILPIDSDGEIWFVRQYRHPAGLELLELPAGTLEEGEEPEECARRELQEEIGMSAGRMTKLGEFYMAPGYSTEFMYIYLAEDLTPSTMLADEDEFLSIEKKHLHLAFADARNGKILDSKSLAALFLAQPYLISPEK